VRGWTEFSVLKFGLRSVARSCECCNNSWPAERLSLSHDSVSRRVYYRARRLLSLRNSRPCMPTLPEWHHGVSSEATFGNEWPCADCSSHLSWNAFDASVDEWRMLQTRRRKNLCSSPNIRRTAKWSCSRLSAARKTYRFVPAVSGLTCVHGGVRKARLRSTSAPYSSCIHIGSWQHPSIKHLVSLVMWVSFL